VAPARNGCGILLRGFLRHLREAGWKEGAPRSSRPGDAYAPLPGELGWGYLIFWTGFSLASWSWMVVIFRLRGPSFTQEPAAS
jgi:hypothetical protein